MHIKAILLTLLIILIWSSNFIFIKVGVSEINPLVLLSLRFTVAGLVFLPFMKWPGWHKAGIIASVGLLMGLLHQGFLYVGLMSTPAGLMSILLQLNVIIATLIGWLFFKETIGWRTWTGILVGMIGIIVLVGSTNLNGNMEGYTYGLISAFFIALAYIAMKKVGTVHPPTYIALLHLPIAPFIFLSSVVIEGTAWMENIPNLNWTSISIVVLYQAIVLSFSHILWQKLIVRYPVSQIVPWTLLIPVFAVAIAVLVLGEVLTLSIFLGGFLTVAGVGIITFRRIQKKQA